MEFEAVIGLEIHVQLNCATKLFCNCPNIPGDEPNQNVCPICLWLPGALPQFSEEALEKATLACLALNCEIQEVSAFDQKVYYYPDLPKGYQLSQAHKPLSKNGWLNIIGEDGQLKRLRIHHVHLEEDVARLVHETEGRTPISLVDFNRAGTPLIEIVTEPDMRNPYDAMEFVRKLRTQVRYAGSAECSLEQGTMRVDANISVREKGSDVLNTKVEVKNMNSIRSIGDAIAYEINRQIASVKNGESIILHTRLWDPDKNVTVPMRGKFEGPCVPDPSVPQIIVREEWLQQVRSRLPEMPDRKIERFTAEYKVSYEEALLMAGERDLSEYFEAVVNKGIAPRLAVQWLAAQLLPALKERNESFAESKVTPERFAALLAMLEREEINSNAVKEVLNHLFTNDKDPQEVVAQYGLKQVSDTGELEGIVESILSANPTAVEDYRGGKGKALGFLVGQAMQASQGKANPKKLREIILKRMA